MLLIPRTFLDLIAAEAEAAHPRECCGLLAGRDAGPGDIVVTRMAPSANLTGGRAEDSFEVDPQVRFDLMRALDGSDKRIIGHYHSHPAGPARPSATDLAKAYEPDLIWVILGMENGRVADVRAHRLAADGGRFDEFGLSTTDGVAADRLASGTHDTEETAP